MRMNPYISCCGRYDCSLCDYHRGVIVEAAKALLEHFENHGSLRLIAEHTGAYDYDGFFKGLKWIASRDEPCKGCRLGGGWSWSPDCFVRKCLTEKGMDFCHKCGDFPCDGLQTEPLLARKRKTIEANEQIRTMGLEKWAETMRKKNE
jgi:hypothetical protein